MHFTDLSINDVNNHDFRTLIIDTLKSENLHAHSNKTKTGYNLNLEVLESNPLLANLKSAFNSRSNKTQFFYELENVMICLKKQGDLYLKEIKNLIKDYNVDSSQFNQVEKTELLREKENSLRGLRHLTLSVLAKILEQFSFDELEPFTDLIGEKLNFSVDYAELLLGIRRVPLALQNKIIHEITKSTKINPAYAEKCIKLISLCEKIDYEQANILVDKICSVDMNTNIYRKGIICLRQLCERSEFNRQCIKQALDSYFDQGSIQLIALKLELLVVANLRHFTKEEIDQFFNRSSKFLDRYLIGYLDTDKELGLMQIPRLTFLAENLEHPNIREVYRMMAKLGKQDLSVSNIVKDLLSEVKRYILEDLSKYPLEQIGITSDIFAGIRQLTSSTEDIQLECLIIALGLMADSNPDLLIEYRNLLKYNDPKINTLILKNLNLTEVEKPRELFQFINELLLVANLDTYKIVDRELCGLEQAYFTAFVDQAGEYFRQLMLVYFNDPHISPKIRQVTEFIQSLQDHE